MSVVHVEDENDDREEEETSESESDEHDGDDSYCRWQWNTDQRRKRALEQKIYLINCACDDDNNQIVFTILGTTGVEYLVSVQKSPRGITCTCPDYVGRCEGSGYYCKHIYNVLFKVLGFHSQSNPSIRAVLTQAAEFVLSKAKVAKVTRESQEVKVRDYVGSDCAICYEPMAKDAHVFSCTRTGGCGNSVHRDCWDVWVKKNKTCVYCRLSQ